MLALLDRLGFPSAALLFTFRSGITAALALLIALACGLEHPQWAAMSVWAASQPLRGQIVEKSLFRLIGTFVGAVAGMGLLYLGALSQPLMVAAFALWVALCTMGAHLTRGYQAYGTVLAGYTAGMVALLDQSRQHSLFELGLDRFLTVFIGVAAITVVALLLAPKGLSPAELRAQARQLSTEALRWLALPQPDRAEGQRLIQRLAQFDEGLDAQGAGSWRAKARAQGLRQIIVHLTPLILLRQDLTFSPAQIQQLQALADNLTADSAPQIPQGEGRTAEIITRLAQAIADWHAMTPVTRSLPAPRDYPSAFHAGLRALLMLALMGSLWQLSGWEGGNFLMLGLSVMISIMSTFESPLHIMPKVVIGQIGGILLALCCRWLVWPIVEGPWGEAVAMVPFILIGALVFAHRKAPVIGFDLNMVFLLMLTPGATAEMSFATSLLTSLGILSAPVLAIVAYRFVFRADGPNRLAARERMIRRKIAKLPAQDPQARDSLYVGLLSYLPLASRWGEEMTPAFTLAHQAARRGEGLAN